jgi:Xaa-Pro aminopeptidase
MSSSFEPFRSHRDRFLQALGRVQGAALVFSGAPKLKCGDTEYRFRPDSDFWYLTGLEEPHAALLCLPPGPERPRGESVLFLRERKPEEELWTGARLGVQAAPAALGLERAFPIGEWSKRLGELLRGYRRLYYRTGLDEARDRQVLALLAALRANSRAELVAPTELVDLADVLHEQRLFKTPFELERMRAAAALTARAHRRAMAEVGRATNEREVDALLAYEFRRGGAWGSAYTNIVAGGANACTLHYHANEAPLKSGELLLVDAGAEVDGYACDLTRTFPIDGRFSEAQRALYEVVLAAQLAGIAAATVEHTLQDVHRASVSELARGLARLGLLAGTPEEIVKAETYRRFYMHRTSHWLGLDVHDCGAYVVGGEPRALEPGMVLTVEPGLYVSPEAADVDRRWRGIGIRIEDDVLVTAQGPEVLTAAAPKTVAEIEAACAGH